MGPEPLKGLLVLLVYYISATEGEIRCYCTESGCVTTGYMCKSQLGMCYSLVKYLDDGAPNPTHGSVVHGCADTLNREPRLSTCAGPQGLNNNNNNDNIENVIKEKEEEVDIISRASSSVSTSSKDRGNGTVEVVAEVEETVIIEERAGTGTSPVDPAEPRLTCCTQDMCNYRDISIFIETPPGNDGVEGVSSERTQEIDKPQKDVWFKAAVIAVPIAGGFILILLVLLAVRMLRTDSRHHRRLIQIRRERSLTKAQLYVTDHFVEKDQKVTSCDNQSHVINKDQKAVTSPCDDNHSHQQINTTTTGHTTKRDHSNHSHTSNNTGHSHTHNHSHSHNNNAHRNSNSHHHNNKHGHAKQTTNRDGYTYEQIVTQNSDSSFPNCDLTVATSNVTPCVPSTYPSVIVWGQPKHTDPGDVV